MPPDSKKRKGHSNSTKSRRSPRAECSLPMTQQKCHAPLPRSATNCAISTFLVTTRAIAAETAGGTGSKFTSQDRHRKQHTGYTPGRAITHPRNSLFCTVRDATRRLVSTLLFQCLSGVHFPLGQSSE